MGANEDRKSAWEGCLMRRLLFWAGAAMLAFGYYSEFTGYMRDSVLQWGAFIFGVASLVAADWKTKR